MNYLLANNATAKPTVTVSEVATTIELAEASASLLAALALVDTGVTQMRLTLSDSQETKHEIVEVTAYTDTPTPTVTVTRAQEDTSAQAWITDDNISLRLTAGLIEELLGDFLTEGDLADYLKAEDLEGEGTDSVAIGRLSNAEGTNSIAIGLSANAFLTRGVALGNMAWATKNYGVAIGGQANGDSEYCVVIGQSSKSQYGDGSVAVGAGANAQGELNVCVGRLAESWNKHNVVIGYDTYGGGEKVIAIGYQASVQNPCTGGMGIGADTDVYEGAVFGVALGFRAQCYVPHGCHAALLFFNPAASRLQALASGDITTRQRTAPVITLASDEIDLLASSPYDTYEIDIPTGCHFYPDRIDLIITSADTPGGTPKFIVGTSDTPGNDILTEKTITVNTAHARQSETPDSLNGVDHIYISVTAAGTGTELKARVFVTGMLVEDE